MPGELLSNPGAAKAYRVMAVMLQMKKLDVAAWRRA
jgi:hypothetical protein